MKSITIQITEQQEKFLKLFAEKQYPGSEDNRYTAYPLHIVENKRYKYIPYSNEIAEFMDEGRLCFTTDDDYSIWFTDEVELVKDWYDGEECPVEVKPYAELEMTDFTGVNGDEYWISDYNEYFKAYGIEIRTIAWREEEYEPAAPFFILEEAKRYMHYQKHNLTEPRVYTYAAGYGSQGDYIHFWEFLMTSGKTLIANEVKS
jgi:hypothetical protein